MASSTTSGVYVHVIEDVINKVREEFLIKGPGESVLNELQGIWELKMMQAGAILNPIERLPLQTPTPGSAITPVHDLNVPYEGTDEYETPTADILFPPTPIQTPLPGTAQTPLRGTADGSLYNYPPGGALISPNEYPSVIDSGGVNEMKPGRPSPYMQPPSGWINQRPPLDVNVAYVEGREELDRGSYHQLTMQEFFMMSSGKRKRDDFSSQYHGSGYIPQQDGAGDAMSVDFQGSEGSNIGRAIFAAGNKIGFMQGVRSSLRISQLDGPIPDPYDDVLSTPNIYNYQGVVNEDYNIANTPAPNDLVATPAVITQNNVGDDDDDDEPLNENDDDDYDDVDQGEDLNTQHLVLAQFDKVTRTKSRWKCTLKDGIMHVNNNDILFIKATGEFDF